MPTTRPRHLVTETEDLAAALDAAAALWPQLSRPQLLVRLALEGSRVGHEQREERRRRRAEAIRRHSGAGTDLYGADYVDRLREDWPT